MPLVTESTGLVDVNQLLQDDNDFEYEEELARDPYNLRAWWRYLQSKKHAKHRVRFLIYERAVKNLPRSYKLWKNYLDDRLSQAKFRSVTDKKCVILVNCYERALVHLHKMPRIWLDYCNFLMHLKKITAARRAFDRALQALPITQHNLVWDLYIKCVKEMGIWQTGVRVYSRYLQYDNGAREDFVDYLMSMKQFGEAARQLSIICSDDNFISKNGRTRHQQWMALCTLVAKHPDKVPKDLNVEAIIRAGFRRFTDEVGRLWCTLADYYIRLGQFESARDVYEEGITTVMTVRDFSMIFDAYAQFEESMIRAKMELVENPEDEEEEDEEQDGAEATEDVEFRLARLEHLMDRRPVLLSSVLLRQNPHNVAEWLKRVKLFKDDPTKVIITFTEAVKTVDPQQAVGKLHSLWVKFAKYYEEHEDIANARVIFQKASLVPYRSVEELAVLYCEWVEMELRHEAYKDALRVIREATKEPAGGVGSVRIISKGSEDTRVSRPVQQLVYRSPKLWSLRVDLEESLGTVQSTREAYDRCLELKVATPQIIINYASFLEENKYFEDSFRAFEKGINLFTWPHVYDIWLAYLTKFVARYKGTKLERARDLFEQVLSSVPSDKARIFYLKYAKLEEEFGLVKHAMSVYDRATRAVPAEGKEKYEMFLLYIKKVEEFYGVTRTREVYEKAVAELPDEQVPDICYRFASMEVKLGEIDRARAIYIHASQYCDPRTKPQLWTQWKEFEIAHGNEETFRDMLRINRSVAAQYSQVNYMAAEMAATSVEHIPSDGDVLAKLEARKIAEASENRQVPETRVPPRSREQELEELQRATGAPSQSPSARQPVEENPEEIDLDEEEEEGGEKESETGQQVNIAQKAVPDAVFGSAKTKLEAANAGKRELEQEEKPLGALDRFKKRKTG